MVVMFQLNKLEFQHICEKWRTLNYQPQLLIYSDIYSIIYSVRGTGIYNCGGTFMRG